MLCCKRPASVSSFCCSTFQMPYLHPASRFTIASFRSQSILIVTIRFAFSFLCPLFLFLIPDSALCFRLCSLFLPSILCSILSYPILSYYILSSRAAHSSTVVRPPVLSCLQQHQSHISWLHFWTFPII